MDTKLHAGRSGGGWVGVCNGGAARDVGEPARRVGPPRKGTGACDVQNIVRAEGVYDMCMTMRFF